MNPARNRDRLNVFSGPDAVKDFLDPDRNPPLPLVEVPPHLNPLAQDGVRIFAKLMNFLPLGNVKSLPAYNMLRERQEQGELAGVRTLIENSSGNTVFSLAVIGRLFGIPRTKAIVSHEVTRGKLQLLRLFGTAITVNREPICPDPSDKASGIHKARRRGARPGWFNPGQYDNEANPRAHARWTGPQIWEQTGGKITVFCAGLGTTGTILGAGGYLKKRSPALATVGVARQPNNPVPGVRTPNLLREIAFDWKSSTDHVEEVGTEESFARSLDLCRAGIVAGPSSGFALAGLLQFLERRRREGALEGLRNKEGEIVAVFICPDSPLPYLDEYFEYLDPSFFPEIEHQELLLDQPSPRKSARRAEIPAGLEADPDAAYRMIYKVSPRVAWALLKDGEEVPIRPGTFILDIRSRGEFLHFHLPGSRRIDARHVPMYLKRHAREWKKGKVLLVCALGVRTRAIAGFLREKGVRAYSLRGGAAEWSARNLPRWRPEVCRV